MLSQIRTSGIRASRPLASRSPATVERLEGRRLLSVSLNVNTDSGGTVHEETTLAVNPVNPLNMIGSSNEVQIDPRGNAARQKGILFDTPTPRARVTFDGGQTWTTYEIPFNGYGFGGDPSVSFDADGTAYFSAIASAQSQKTSHRTGIDVIVSRSADGGRTWTNPTRVAAATGSTAPTAPSTSYDKPFVAAWGDGNAVVTFTQFVAGQGGDLVDVPVLASVTH